jgi:osmotically-inducible protein OsmY
MAASRPFHAVAIVLAVALVAGSVAGCRTMTGRSTGRYIDDAKITTSVKAKLVADKAVNLTRVGVNTVNGTVYLDGVVETAEQRVRAEELARRAEGVKSVVNNIQVATR